MNLTLAIKNAINKFRNGSLDNLSTNENGIIIPEWLKKRQISDDDSKFLIDFFNDCEIKNFSEITAELINSYGNKSYESVIKVCNLLGLYGVKFLGRSANKYSPNFTGIDVIVRSNDSQESIYNLKFTNSHIDFVLNRENEIKIFNSLKSENILTIKQLNGLHLGVFSNKTNINVDQLEELFNNTGLTIIKYEQDLLNFYDNEIKCDSKNQEETELQDNEKNYDIDSFSFSTRTFNILKANNIKNLNDLKSLTEAEILSFKNAGRGTLNEICNKLKEFGFLLNSEKELNLKSDLLQEAIPIDLNTYQKPISELILENRALNALKKAGINKIGDILDFTYEDIKKIEGLGYSSINELRNTLRAHGIDLNNKYILSDDTLDERYFINIFEANLSEVAKNIFRKFNIKNLGQLLEIFPDDLYKDDEFCSATNIFEIESEIRDYLKSQGFDSYPVKFSKAQKDKLNEPDLQEILELNICDLLTQKIKEFEDKYITTLDGSRKLVYQARIKPAKKRTLQELGEETNVTRERIRQIEHRLRPKIAKAFNENCLFLNILLDKLFNEFGHIVSLNNFLIENEYREIIQDFINNSDYYKFKLDFDNQFFLSKTFDLDNLYSCIIENIPCQNDDITSFESIVNIFEHELVKYLKQETEIQKNNYLNVKNKLINIIIENYFIKLDSDSYKLKRENNRCSDRNQQIYYAFEKLFPNGVHLPINNDDQLRKNLMPLIDAVPTIKNNSIRSLSDNILKSSKDVILWDRGLYIHINNTSPDWSIVDKAIYRTIELFDQGISEFKIYKIFAEKEEDFVNGGIPNYNALWGLMKYRENPRIKYRRLEVYDANLTQDKKDLLEIFETFVKSKEGFISKKELKDYFCEDRGWKDYQLDLLLGRSDNVIKNGQKYVHISNLKYDINELKRLASLISQKVDSIGPIKLSKIKEDYHPTWCSVFNNSVTPEFMGEVLRKQQNLSFSIERKIYAMPLSQNLCNTEQEITFETLLSDFVYKQSISNHRVGMKEVYEFCEERGFNSWNASNTLRRSGMLEYFDGFYVHPDVIGYSDELLEELINITYEAANIAYENKIPHVLIESIIQNFEDKLPALNSNYEWTERLIASLLCKIKDIEVFNKSFIFTDNPFNIEDMDDIAAYILALEFPQDGICKYSKLEKLLRREGIIGNNESINTYKQALFADGSSIELVDDGNNIMLSKIGRDKYLNA